MSRRSVVMAGLVVAIFVAGCGEPDGFQPVQGPPDVSVMDDLDPPITTPAPSCANGYRLTLIPRNAGGPAVRSSAGVWHRLYGVRYSSGGRTFVGLRHISSDDYAHPHSIAWLADGPDGVLLGIGPDDVPTAIYPSWAPSTAPFALTRARFLNGAWQIDAKPFWTANIRRVPLFVPLVIDANNHAHVVVGGTVITDASGAWVANSVEPAIAPRDAYPEIAGLAADAAGHDYVSVRSWNGSVIGSNVSGQFATMAGVDAIHANQYLGTDGAGHVRGFGFFDGKVVVTDLTARRSADLVGVPDDPSLTAEFGALDRAGNPVLYAYNTTSSPVVPRVLSVVNGTLQSQPATFLPMEVMMSGMVLDGAGVAHFIVNLLQGERWLPGYLDPC
jgi:hypothetical protein